MANHDWQPVAGDHPFPLFRCTRCGSHYEIRSGKAAPPKRMRSLACVAKGQGPGDYLKMAITRWTGQKPDAECGCEDWIARMNRRGTDWCRKNLKRIVSHLRREARQRRWLKYAVKLPAANAFIAHMVTRAIQQSEAANAH